MRANPLQLAVTETAERARPALLAGALQFDPRLARAIDAGGGPRTSPKGCDTASHVLPPRAGVNFDPDPELTYSLVSPVWYALRLRSNQEFRVQRALDALAIETFLPSWSEETQWADRKKIIVRPLFPGYLFMRSQTREDVLAALRVAGVVQVLPDSLRPESIDDSEIQALRRVGQLNLRARPCAYVAGDRVTIESGSLAGIKGVVVRTRGATHVVVAIELLRRAVKVEIDADTLVKAPDAPEAA